jgi:hypothetical protein
MRQQVGHFYGYATGTPSQKANPNPLFQRPQSRTFRYVEVEVDFEEGIGTSRRGGGFTPRAHFISGRDEEVQEEAEEEEEEVGFLRDGSLPAPVPRLAMDGSFSSFSSSVSRSSFAIDLTAAPQPPVYVLAVFVFVFVRASLYVRKFVGRSGGFSAPATATATVTAAGARVEAAADASAGT